MSLATGCTVAGGGGHHDRSSERSLSVNGTVVLLSHVQRPSPVVVRLGGPTGGSFKFTTTLRCRRQAPSLSKPAWARSEQARPLANATVDQGPRESESDFCFGGCAQGPAPVITPSHVLMFGTSLGLMPPDLALGGLGCQWARGLTGGSPPRQGRATGRVPVPGVP